MNRKRIRFSLSIIAAVGYCIALSPGYAAGNGVMHSVHVGGNDACEAIGQSPGCDANFSSTAIQKYDGSVKGQHMDRFAGLNGMHGNVECLVIQGNVAFVLGTVTSKYRNGDTFFSVFEDNGKSKKDDPDRISPTFIYPPSNWSCSDSSYLIGVILADFMNDLTRGQVTIK